MQKYDEINFVPPAPVASVDLENMKTGEKITGISMLVDTGADITLLPESITRDFTSVELIEGGYQVEGFDGSRSSMKAVELRLIFLNKGFRGRFLINEKEEGILGRDILNHLRLFFDGKNLEWDEDLTT